MLRPLLFALLLVLLVSPVAPAQESQFREDLRFAESLRNRGDNDLALELLEKIAANAPPELARELPLEFAKTRLRVAGDEPETARRLRLYQDARADFQKFIDANPGHARLAEANLDIARVLNLQGKAQLSQALLTEEVKTKKEIAAQARATLVQAAARLQAAVTALESAKGKLADPETIADPKMKKEAAAARDHVEREIKQTQIERGLNLYDQSATYLGGSDDLASSRLVQAKKALDELAAGAAGDPATWKARAWIGRIQHQIQSADNARKEFAAILGAGETPVTTEGVRLARYFRLLVIKEQPNDEDKKAPGGPNRIIIDSASTWRARYPRYLKTPEGCGITFLLAQTYLAEADVNKKLVPTQRDDYRSRARALLRELESTENEFTDRARRLKIQALARLGLFSRRIDTLRTFEDFYIRAQYEAFQLSKEEKADKRKKHIDNILTALKSGLALPEAKKMKPGLELNTARALMAYWSLNAGTTEEGTTRLEDAARVGESFAREDPRSSQAAMSAVYALQAYGQLLERKKDKVDEEELAGLRARMFSLAHYMEERWPNETPGELARHSLGLQLLKEENFPEAIKKLSLITPSYGNYALALYQLADAASRADKASVAPIAGDRPGDYRKRALLAWESMPASALGPTPFINHIYVDAKVKLGRELFRYQRYQQIDDLVAGLLPRLNALKFNDDEDKDRGTRNQLRYELVSLQLYARYGLADAALRAEDYARVAALLDPLIDAAGKPGDNIQKSVLQKDTQLAPKLLSTALRANLQVGKIDRTETVLEILNKVTAEGDAASSNNTLRLLAFLIRGQVEEVRKKGDQEALDKAIKGYSTILDKQIAKQKGELKPDFIRVLAECYSSMGEHARAAGVLSKVPEPRGKVSPDEEKMHWAIQLLTIRELRQSKTPADIKKARALMDKIRGPEPKPKSKTKPGWARTNLDALKEHGNLLEAEEKWPDAFQNWASLVRQLARHAQKGGQPKEHYLECYYHMVECYVKIGAGKASKTDRDKFLRQAAQQVVQLERNWGEDFGSEASKKRFTELLGRDAGLKEHYDTLRKKK
jgi:hypothetical protein